VAQVLCPVHRKCWWKQRHEVSLLPLLSGQGSTQLPRVT
jgi:hypothetical protein